MGTQTWDTQQDKSLQAIGPLGAPVGRSQQGSGPCLSVVHARDVDDAFAVIRVVRGNEAVLLNCSQLPPRLGVRLIDICSGGVCAMDGQVHRISPDLVLFTPGLTRVHSA